MPIEFICNHCGRTLTVQDFLSGQAIDCYECGQPVVVPMVGEQAIIEFQCLGCGKDYRVPASRAGSRTTCPECKATITVPGGQSQSAPPIPMPVRPAEQPVEQLYYEEPPAPAQVQDVPQYVSPHLGSALRARSAAQEPQQEGEPGIEYIPAPRKGVSPALIAGGALLAVGLIVVLALMFGGADRNEPRGRYVRYMPQVRVNTPLRLFEVVNLHTQTLHDVQIVINAAGQRYSYGISALSPGENVSVDWKTFKSSSGVSYNPDTMRGQWVKISARLPGGEQGFSEMEWHTGP